MINEEYFKKFEEKYLKYWWIAQSGMPDVRDLAKEISKYTDDEKALTRIMNALRRANICSLEALMDADIDRLAKLKGIGLLYWNILRQVKGYPVVTEAETRPFVQYYRVYFYNTEKGGSWHEDFHTLKELSDYFNDDKCKGTSINYISKVEKGDK